MIIRNYLFHRVSDEKDPMWPPMKPALFSAIIQYLTKNFQVVPLEHYLDDPGAYRTKKKLATVLFDDGYKDNIELAAPVLQKYKCPASFYVVTDCINRNIPTWTYMIDSVFRQTRKQKLTLMYEFVPEKFRLLPLRSGDSSGEMVKEIKPWLKKLTNPQRLAIMESILDQCNDVTIERNKMMNWNDIRQLNTAGFIIGSHSHTHPMLASLQDESEIADELAISAETIFRMTGKMPATISYPIGNFDERVTRLAKEKDYKYGMAVYQRFFRTRKNDMLTIPRVELHQEPWWKVKMRIRGIYNSLREVWV